MRLRSVRPNSRSWKPYAAPAKRPNRRSGARPSSYWPKTACPIRQLRTRSVRRGIWCRSGGSAVACQGAEERELGGFSHYSVRDVARLLAGRGEILTMSPATVQRILAALVLKPHRLRYFLTRTDPQFEEKMAEIVDLYLHPPRHSRVLCLDEKTGIQALERLHPTRPLRPGLVERQEFEYLRHG